MSKDESTCGCGDGGCGGGGSGGGAPSGGGGGTGQFDGESFHPMGDEWESEMEEMLDDTEYDTELGMEMARDAMRLVAGELSEEEFQDRYHDAVVEEFGVDDRPTAPEAQPTAASDADADADADADGGHPGILETMLGQNVGTGDGGMVTSLSEIDPDTDQTRRETMKKMGVAGAALGLGAWGTKDNLQGGPEEPSVGTASAQEDDGDGTQYGMVIDLERCDGCLQCVTGCIDENRTSTGANWMYVLTFEDENTESENFLVRPCQHCQNAPCEKVCPVEARHTRDRDGIVLTNYETCIGCRYCQVACPYGVNYFQWGEPTIPYGELAGSELDHGDLKDLSEEERQEQMIDANDHVHDYRGQWNDSRPPQGVMGKCTFCPSRQDGHTGEDMVGTVACQDACDIAGMSAIHFGDMNDEESRPRRYLRQRVEDDLEDDTELDIDEEWGETVTGWRKLSAFRLLDDIGTQPSVVYLGNEPGRNAKQVEGPVSYDRLRSEDGRDVVDRRKDHLDQFTVGIGGD